MYAYMVHETDGALFEVRPTQETAGVVREDRRSGGRTHPSCNRQIPSDRRRFERRIAGIEVVVDGDLGRQLVAARSIADGCLSNAQEFKWHWTPAVTIASPPGEGCFRASMEYSHGRVSIQEMVTPVLRVIPGCPTADFTITK